MGLIGRCRIVVVDVPPVLWSLLLSLGMLVGAVYRKGAFVVIVIVVDRVVVASVALLTGTRMGGVFNFVIVFGNARQFVFVGLVTGTRSFVVMLFRNARESSSMLENFDFHDAAAVVVVNEIIQLNTFPGPNQSGSELFGTHQFLYTSEYGVEIIVVYIVDNIIVMASRLRRMVAVNVAGLIFVLFV